MEENDEQEEISLVPQNNASSSILFQNEEDVQDHSDLEQLSKYIASIQEKVNGIEKLVCEKIDKDALKVRRAFWSPQEHQEFLKHLEHFGPKKLKEITAAMGGTRTLQQVRTHAQKYLCKVEKHHEEINRVTTSVLAKAALELERAVNRFGSPETSQFYEQVLPLITDEPLRYVGALISYEVTTKAVPSPLQFIGNAMRVLRKDFPQMPYGNYQKTDQTNNDKVMQAVSGYTQKQDSNIFVNLIYRNVNNLLIKDQTREVRFALEGSPFDVPDTWIMQLNIQPFLVYCSAYLSYWLLKDKGPQSIVSGVVTNFHYNMLIRDSYDHSLWQTAKIANLTEDQACCIVFCWYVCFAYKLQVSPPPAESA